MATAAKALKPGIEVLGVESRLWSAMHQRLAGEPVAVGGDTIAEGMAVRDVGEVPCQILRELGVEVLLVAEETIERAIAALIEIEKTVAEGAGAAGLAALLEHPQRFRGRKVGIPICGGNIDSRLLASVLMRSLAREGKLVRLRVVMPDVAGSLAKVAALIGAAGGNIVEVEHQRVFGTASIKSPAVEFVIETRDREHTRALIAALAAEGVRAELRE
jgi:threonine dehydratase